MNFRIKLLRYCDFTSRQITQFLGWLGKGNKVTDPYHTIMQVANANGETVLYAPLEHVYLLHEVAANPHALPHELADAGDAINRELARLSRQSGATKILMTLPAHVHEHAEFTLRVVEREIPATVNTQFDAKQHGPLVRFVH